MKWKAFIVVVLLSALVVLPVVMRARLANEAASADVVQRLTIITPHNETIRREFGRAFETWWMEKTGQRVAVSWLTPGGTSEIVKVLTSSFQAAEDDGRVGVGIDLFFGGGDYDFRRLAGEFSEDESSYFEELAIFDSHPEYFTDGMLRQEMRGEKIYGEKRDWLGVCLSSFGICYNSDACQRIGVEAPKTWSDLGDPRYTGQMALADPTKSGSVTKAFEMILQKEIQDALNSGTSRVEALELGWERGINLIRRIGANARYFTDSATKIPRDVADGNAVAGLCIDYYGRTFNESFKDESGHSRIQFVAPRGATSWSVDPVSVLRGAPERELASGFVEFLMSWEGQRLWNVAPGQADGPRERALRRLPVRPDLYQDPAGTKDFVDSIDPYAESGDFCYDYSLTGPIFSPLRILIRAMCIETHDELVAAWRALAQAGFPPEACAAFDDMKGLSLADLAGPVKKRMKGSKLEAVRLESELSERFRLQYQKAKSLAEQGR